VQAVESAVPYVYLLRCRDGSLYAGAAKDLERRLAEHRAGQASRYTRSRLPVELAWWRQVESWGDALRQELLLKRLDRAGKEELLRAGLAPVPAPANSAGAGGADAADVADADGAAPSD
jgi:putative endonuclease